MTETISLRREGGLAHLEFRRPEVLNAINESFCRRLVELFDELEQDGEVSVVILSGGESRAFCSGADLKFMRALSGASLRRFIEQTWNAFDRIARSHLVSIAALHGYVLGGGAELALACDIRIADETTEIGFPEMSHGSVPGSGAMQRLPLAVGRAKAIEIVLGGQRVGGREAEALGLVNRCVPKGQSLAAATEWAERFASRPPEAVRFMKAALALGQDARVAPVLHGLVSSVCQSAPGYRSATRSFEAKDEETPKKGS